MQKRIRRERRKQNVFLNLIIHHERAIKKYSRGRTFGFKKKNLMGNSLKLQLSLNQTKKRGDEGVRVALSAFTPEETTFYIRVTFV